MSSDPSNPVSKATLSVSRQEIDERDPSFRVMPDGGQAFTVLLLQRTLNIGSDPRQDISIQAAGIDVRHARLLQESGNYRIYDLTEHSGVLVNNQPIEGSRVLHDGDTVRLQGRDSKGATLSYSNPVERSLGTDSVGRLYPFEAFPFVIGRDPAAAINLDSLAVSARHAVITEQGGAHILTDQGSTNGTFVNDRKLTAPYRLRPEDVIRIDKALLVYKGRGLMRLAATQRFQMDGINLEMTYRTGFPRRSLNTMRDVSLGVQPKEFIAIIGGSGSGKSTLLRILNGANPATGGKVTVNGTDLYDNYELFQPIIGYVPQTDIVQDSLTIHQSLVYGARLRFPNESDQDREKRIVRVLDWLELTDFKDRLVGRLSGGQKKRVSIALELMAEPALLFLDEPSSGLDPGLDKQLMQTLRNLADRGHVVLVVTHTTLNIELCDHLVLMSRGYLTYFGPPKEALDFFGVRDYSEIYNAVQQAPEALKQRASSATMIFNAQASASIPTKAEKTSPVEAARLWAEKYKTSPQYEKYVAERIKETDQTTPKHAESALANKQLSGARRGSFWQQARVLTDRTIALVRRDMRTIISMLLVLPLVGLFLGLISFDPVDGSRGQMLVSRGDNTAYTTVYDKLKLEPVPTPEAVQPTPTPPPADNSGGGSGGSGGTSGTSRTTRSKSTFGQQTVGVGTFTPASDAQRLLFMTALAVTLFGIFASAYTIVAEKSLFLRERMVNLRITPYLASKTVVYAGLALLSCLLFLGLISIGVRLPDQGLITWGPLEIFISVALTALAGVSMGVLLSAINKQINAVTYMVLGVLFVQILFAGVLFKMDGPILEPLSRLTITRWSLEALGGSVHMMDRNAEGKIITESQPTKDGVVLESAPRGRQVYPAPPAISFTYPTTEGDLAVRWLVLLAFSGVFLFLSTLSLNRSESF